MVITNKRLVTIPIPPNKKNFEIESYYFKDMASAKSVAQAQASTEGRFADFSVSMNSGGGSKYLEGGVFRLRATLAKAFLNEAKSIANDFGNQFSQMNAMIQTQSNQMTAKDRGDRYYMEIKATVSKADFSKAGHQQIRDCIVALINQCITAANA